MSDQFTRDDVTTLLLEVMDWTYVQATRDRPMTDAEKKVIDDIRTALAAPCLEVTVDPRLTPDEAAAISSALAAPRPEPEPVAYFDLQKQVFFWAKPTMIDVPMTVALNPLPLYAAPPAAAPSEDIDALRQELAAVLSDWNSLVCASGSSTNGGAVGHVAALRREAERYRWLRGEHSRIDPCIKANAKYKLERQSSTWVEIHDLDAAIDAAMKEGT